MVARHGSLGKRASPRNLTSIQFIGQSGWVTGYDGVILHSADGGLTWSAQTTGHQGVARRRLLPGPGARLGCGLGRHDSSYHGWRQDLAPGANRCGAVVANVGVLPRCEQRLDRGIQWADLSQPRRRSYMDGANQPGEIVALLRSFSIAPIRAGSRRTTVF